MKAAVIEATNQAITIKDIPTPQPAAGEVIVKLKAAALNHRDVFIQQGRYPGIKLPIVLGSDGSGAVSAVGNGVSDQWIGQEVIINCSHNWGPNERFNAKNYKILGLPDNGTFAEYISVEARYLVPKPNHLSFDQAAALPLACLTGWRALMSRAKLQTNEKVLITGIGGGVALIVLQLAVAAGAEVWVTSGADDKIAKAIDLGAKGGVNYKDENWAKNLLTAAGADRSGYFDVIIDSAGGSGFAKLIDVAAIGARICFFGGTTGNITDLVPAKIFFKHLDILGSTMGSERDFNDMIAFVETHQIKPIIDAVFELDDTENALRKMDSGAQFGKIVLRISKD